VRILGRELTQDYERGGFSVVFQNDPLELRVVHVGGWRGFVMGEMVTGRCETAEAAAAALEDFVRRTALRVGIAARSATGSS